MLYSTVVSEQGTPIAWTEPDDGWVEPAHRLESVAGTSLHLPASGGGSAGRSMDQAWLRRRGRAAREQLDTNAWQAAAHKRLQPGEALAPVWRLDLRRMRVSGMIQREGDPGCCPGGGRSTAWLVPREARLELRRVIRR